MLRLAMTEIVQSVREKGWKVCKQLLPGKWNKLTMENFLISKISGGLSNHLYLCQLPKGSQPDGEEPKMVLMRIYGQILQENASQVVLDSVVFTLLSEKKLGPKLYGVFKTGRLEEYIPSRALYTSELQIPDYSRNIAEIMSDFHKLEMPICKEPKWLFSTMIKWLSESQNNALVPGTSDVSDQMNAVRHAKLSKIVDYNLSSELDNLRNLLAHVSSPVVFCHNDLQEGNILFMGPKENNLPNLMAIDFEYSSYNYRGFDLGNHFNEWCYDYTYNKPPYYLANYDNYPSKEQQIIFAKSYLAAYNEGDFSDSEIEGLLLEANTYVLASHFFWGLWSLVCSHASDIKFGYLDYALDRFDTYFRIKSKHKVPTDD